MDHAEKQRALQIHRQNSLQKMETKKKSLTSFKAQRDSFENDDPRSPENRMKIKKIQAIKEQIKYEKDFQKKKKDMELQVIRNNDNIDFNKQLFALCPEKSIRLEKLAKIKKIQR